MTPDWIISGPYVFDTTIHTLDRLSTGRRDLDSLIADRYLDPLPHGAVTKELVFLAQRERQRARVAAFIYASKSQGRISLMMMATDRDFQHSSIGLGASLIHHAVRQLTRGDPWVKQVGTHALEEA